MAAVAVQYGVPVIAMHNHAGTQYQGDILAAMRDFFRETLRIARQAGLPEDQLIFDPGIGFGKTVEHNLDLLAGLDRLSSAGYPVVAGVSRKSFLGALTGERPGGRLAASLSALSYALTRGANVMRVHDVKESCHAARVVDILLAHEEGVNGCRRP